MLRLVIGTDWVAIRREIIGSVADDVANRRGGRILMVPELISHDTERRLAAAAGDTASRYAEVLTFTRLARRVSDAVGGAGLECLDNGGRVVAMAAAARQLSSRLKAYGAVETKPEFLRELVDAVDEFKRCRISSQDLMEASKRAEGTLAQKLEELSLLLGAYDGICAQGKRDPRDRENLLLEQLEDSDFAENHVFYIDGFPDYTRQHLAILEHLMGHSPLVTVGINCDEIGSRALAFEKAGDTAAQLYRTANRLGVEVRVDVIPGRKDDLGKISRALFQGATPKTEHLQVLQCTDIHEEVTVTAERIMELVRGGCRYRDMAVVCADMGGYQNVLELEFGRCHIPLYRSGTEDILSKTVICTVLAALDAALGGMEQRDVMRYLKSVLSPLDGDTCDKVENYAVLWGIRGSGWGKEWLKHPEGLNRDWTEGARRKLNELETARAVAVTPLLRLKEAFDDAKNLGQQVEALAEFLEEIQLARRLDALAEELDVKGDDRQAQILGQLWEILLAALEQMYDVLGNTAWEPEVFVRLLTLLLSQYDVGTIPPVLDAVMAGPVTAMRCQEVKYLFVLGADEGSLPGYGGSAGLLSDQERVALRQLGVPLTGGAMEGIQAEFAEIYGVFCGAQEQVTVSCCSEQPSYVHRRLADMAGRVTNAVPGLGAALADKAEAAGYLAKLRIDPDALPQDLREELVRVRCRMEHSLGTISRENVSRLYGRQLTLSASQIDRQAECRLSYFLKYGLRAQERKEATIDPAEFGTFAHEVLEKTAAKVMELGGFHGVSLEETMEIAAGFAQEYARNHFADLDSSRMEYLFRRNQRELDMVVAELWKELKNSRFLPEKFELGFGQDLEMPAVPVSGGALPAVLRGFVDRVDIWHEEGRNYFRVVDYKTGKKDFDYCDVYNGVGLQMLLYLFALEQGGFGTGVGVQYFPARVPLISVEGKQDLETARKERAKAWVRKGLLLEDTAVFDAMDADGWQRLCVSQDKKGNLKGDFADRQQFQMLRTYLFAYLEKMVSDIASGNVEPNPYTRGSAHDACAWCPYKAVCHDKQVVGRRNYRAMKQDEFWQAVEREVTRHGG